MSDPLNPPGMLIHEVPEGTRVASTPHAKPFIEVLGWTGAANGLIRVNVRYLDDGRIESWPGMALVWGPDQ